MVDRIRSKPTAFVSYKLVYDGVKSSLNPDWLIKLASNLFILPLVAF